MSSSEQPYLAIDDDHHHYRHRRRRRPSRRAVKLVTAAAICTAFTVLFGLTLAVTVVGLIMATPLLVIFSPVLVPAALAAVVVAAGFLVSGGCGMAAAGALGWCYAYVTGRRPPGTDRLEEYYASWPAPKIADVVKSREVKDKALDQSVDHEDADDSATNHLPTPGTDQSSSSSS